MEVTSRSWLLDTTDWWRQPEETHWKYTDTSNVARHIFSFKAPGVWVEASFSPGWDVIGWRQSKTTGETLRKKVVARHFASTTIRLLAGADPLLNTKNTENKSEMNGAAEEQKLHRMAKVHNFLDMWQGSQNLRAN